MYYIWTLNVNATQWYEIRKLENIGKELKDDLNRLESTISEIESLNNIMGDDMYEEMQEASNPNYKQTEKENIFLLGFAILSKITTIWACYFS